MSCEAKATNHFGFNKTSFAFENFSLGFLMNEVSSSHWWHVLHGGKRNIQQIQKLTFVEAGSCLWNFFKKVMSTVKTELCSCFHNRALRSSHGLTADLTRD